MSFVFFPETNLSTCSLKCEDFCKAVRREIQPSADAASTGDGVELLARTREVVDEEDGCEGTGNGKKSLFSGGGAFNGASLQGLCFFRDFSCLESLSEKTLN